MLVNPYADQLSVFAGTRILTTDFGLVGTDIIDQANERRVWTVTSVYAPIPERCLGGVRVKLVDQKGFVTFCNQRDFEVMLGMAKPGDFCRWTGREYPHPHDDAWIGFCVDKIDIQDDLYERELALRAENPILPSPSDIVQRIHPNMTRDYEEFWTLRGDYDFETGIGPDTRIETLYERWSRVSRDWFDWMKV